MIKCALCLQERDPKSNTHYITDFLIRTALNEDGVNRKNKGLYWTFPTDSPFIEFNYQQASAEKIEDILGRPATDEENEKAKSVTDFSVDNIFCKDCEDKFGVIETAFSERLTKKFRGADLNKKAEIELNENNSKLFRLFFLMQIWRASVCEPDLKISQESQEFLRGKIFNQDDTDLEKIAISVSYLETLKQEKDLSDNDSFKTHNIVSLVEGQNPYIFLLNDFVVSFYDSKNYPFESLKGFFEEENYIKYLNINESKFKVKIISDKERREILTAHFTEEVERLEHFKKIFIFIFKKVFDQVPTDNIIASFWADFAAEDTINKYTKDGFSAVMDKFIIKVANTNGWKIIDEY